MNTTKWHNKSFKASPALVLKMTCLIMVLVLLRQFYIDIGSFPNIFGKYTLYESWGVSEWLINYQGGFVRRGLAGEILYRLYQIHPYPVPYLIIGISLVCLVGLTVLCIILFRRMNWPIWLLLFPMFLYYRLYGLEMGILDSRRDCLMLLLSFGLFLQYKRYLLGERIIYVWLLSIFILLLHEGMLFPIFPFLILHSFVVNHISIIDGIKKVVLLWWPVAVSFAVIIVWHGDEFTPVFIWQSWMPCFQTFSFADGLPKLGVAVECLAYSATYNQHLAFDTTWSSYFCGNIPIWPFNIYLLMALYYLYTRMDTIRRNGLSLNKNRVQISNIFLIQLFFVLPMLGFIANDWYRTVPYCCITSCFLCYLFPERVSVPQFVDNFSVYLQSKIESISFLCSPWTYYIILISLPLCLYNARPGGMFPFIPIDIKSRLLEMIIG